MISCGDEDIDYRQEMRDFVQNISAYAKALSPLFLIVPQNAGELLTRDGIPGGIPDSRYLGALDGLGREDLYYGYEEDNRRTPPAETAQMEAWLDLAERNSVEALVIDYCWTERFVDDSYARAAARGYISFAADFRELHNIPDYPAAPFRVHAGDVSGLKSARNFLYLINTALYPDKQSFLEDLRNTDYDLLVVDLFFEGNSVLNRADVDSLKHKSRGGSRLVLAYMSIGEAEDYRYYWNEAWRTSPPAWLDAENPDWPGNFKVRYWMKDWQDIIFGNDASYCRKILDSGFDGAYLDLIDAYEYYEERAKFLKKLRSAFSAWDRR